MTRDLTKPPASVTVGGFPEPDGDQPMTDAEFRMVRDWLGLSGEWLAARLGVTLRTLRRWEAGHSPVPDGVRVEMEQLEQIAAGYVGELVAQLSDAREVVLTIPRESDGEWPASWWRMVAVRVASEVPGLYVRYADE